MAVKAKMPAVLKRIRTLAKRAEPKTVHQAMNHIANAIHNDILLAFEVQRAPEIIHDDVRHLAGAGWAPLAESTLQGRGRKARWAKGRKRTRHTRNLVGKVKKLQDTGHMRKSIRHSVTRSGNAVLARAGVAITAIGASAFYAEIHQFGARHIPARPFVGMRRATIDIALERILKFVTKK